MERVFLCNDIWFDCLPFLSRPKIGFEFAMVSDRFDRLADDHLESKGRAWTIGELGIRQEQGNAVIVKDIWGFLYTINCGTEHEEHLPFPEEPLPKNVIGFKRIYIGYVDHRVIDFLRQIRHLFQPTNNGNDGIELFLDIEKRMKPNVRTWDAFFHSIWPLIDPSAITKLFIPYSGPFDAFRRRISPTFLLDWANLRVVDVQCQIHFEDGENGQLLRQWLLTPRKDGKPKLLRKYKYENLQTVEQLRTEFLGAQTAVSFIIGMYYFDHQQLAPFELDNWRTGERLAFRLFDNNWLLERGPIGGRDAEQWKNWEIEVMDKGMEEHNLLALSFWENAIGLLDETAGPSGQTIAEK